MDEKNDVSVGNMESMLSETTFEKAKEGSDPRLNKFYKKRKFYEKNKDLDESIKETGGIFRSILDFGKNVAIEVQNSTLTEIMDRDIIERNNDTSKEDDPKQLLLSAVNIV